VWLFSNVAISHRTFEFATRLQGFFLTWLRGRATMFVLISPTRLILVTSGEVDDAHLSALRAGLPLIDDS
jgi:hypothetical protein